MFYYRINYIAGSIITLAVTLVFGSLIFFRGRGGRIVRSYFMLMLAIALWSFGMYMLCVAQSIKAALFWGRFLHIGASFVPVFYFHFVIKLLRLENKQKTLTQIGYILACIFALLNFTPYFIKSVSYKLGLNFPDAGGLYPLFVIYFLSYPAQACYLSYKAYRKLTDLGKKQLRYVTVAGILGFMGGGLTFFTVYGRTFPVIGPLVLYLVAIANLFVAIATYTARLMDVELIRRRTLMFSLLYGAVVGIFVMLVFFGQKLLSAHFNLNRWIIPVAALFAITIFIRPLENLLARLTDKVLYQRRYDYMATLKNAAKGMTLITDIKRLLRLIVYLVSKEIRVTGCAIYIFNKSTDSYIKEVKRGFQGLEIADEVYKDSSFIKWLIEKRQPLSYENILSWIQSEGLFPHRLILKRTLEQIRVTMRKLGCSLCVPSFLRGEMIGFLVLGAKLSGERYTSDDMSLLSTLSNNTAIALENARMYEELNVRIAKLHQSYQEEHSLFWDAASAFSYAIDTKDGYTHAHALKVCDCSSAITKELEKLLPYIKFDENFYDTLKIASLLHDVGKIGVSDKILNKEGALTKEEEEELKKHTVIGEAILHPMREIEEVFDLIRHHHENYDGTGYPDGLKEDEIPMISRIIAVANVYDIMTCGRRNRKAMEKEEAIEELKRKAGTQFDPVVVEALLKAYK